MAHVTSIKIEGLLGRAEPIQLELQRDVNVIFGENGCGKTTLLKILDAALSRDSESIQRLPVSKAEVSIFSINHNRVFKQIWERKKDKKNELTVRDWERLTNNDIDDAEREFIYQSSGDTNPWRLTPTLKDSSSNKRWAHTFLPTTRLYLGDRQRNISTARSQLSEAQLDELFAETVNRAWLVYYSNTLQEPESVTNPIEFS